MTLLASILLAVMSSADAIVTILNSPSATSPQKFAEAKEIVSRDAAEGKVLQQFVIAVTTDDKKLAARYLEASRPRIRALAEKRDNPLAWYLLSLETNDFRALRRAAEGGNVQALNALGTIATQEALASQRRTTNSVENILAKSFSFFKRATEKRDANAFINLGTCYLRGFGCEQNFQQAFFCFKAAADAGHPEGMDYVSACFDNGHGVPKDASASLYWRMRARATRGDEAAAQWLRTRKD